MATIGGGLVNGDPNQDPPPALIALGASAVMTSKNGDRVVPLEDLFIDYYETDVQPGEVLTSVLVPRAPAGSGSVYLKFLPRTADDTAPSPLRRWFPESKTARVKTPGSSSVRWASLQ